jgi:hypothetical protein
MLVAAKRDQAAQRIIFMMAAKMLMESKGTGLSRSPW